MGWRVYNTPVVSPSCWAKVDDKLQINNGARDIYLHGK